MRHYKMILCIMNSKSLPMWRLIQSYIIEKTRLLKFITIVILIDGAILPSSSSFSRLSVIVIIIIIINIITNDHHHCPIIDPCKVFVTAFAVEPVATNLTSSLFQSMIAASELKSNSIMFCGFEMLSFLPVILLISVRRQMLHHSQNPRFTESESQTLAA